MDFTNYIRGFNDARLGTVRAKCPFKRGSTAALDWAHGVGHYQILEKNSNRRPEIMTAATAQRTHSLCLDIQHAYKVPTK